jgi:hypothetical protein
MNIEKKVIAMEGLYAVTFVFLGLVCAPVIFYSDVTLTSIWDDTTYTVTALDKYWDDLIRYREFKKVWWKVAMPYVAFQMIRAVVWKARMLVEKRRPKSSLSD